MINDEPCDSSDASLHTLPAQPNAFIGRESDVQAVVDLLDRAQVRLVTLTGPGGTGKTRISLHVGALLLDAYADGVLFVELAPVSEPEQVLHTIAKTLCINPDDTASLDRVLQDYLASKHMLLILDNFEQVIDAAPQVAQLIESVPQVQVLISSRQLLHIPEEHEYRVPPFPVPDPSLLPPLDDLAHNPAVAIFAQRAQHVEPRFQLTDTNAAAIVSICTRLDGLPLAIELAASRVRQFPPEVLLTRLDDSLAVLTRGGRDRSERQQTLRGLIAWSYDLLSVGEQALFGRLGVFAGSFTLAAAETICNIDNDLPITVADGLASLTDKNLLRVSYGADGTPRYSMLYTLREYARYVLERLAPETEAEIIRQQYIAYYQAMAAVVTDVGPLGQTDPSGIMIQLDQEHENFLAAFGVAEPSQTGEILHLGRKASLIIKASLVIERTRSDVFAFASNLANLSQWLSFAQNVYFDSPQTQGLGATAILIGQAMGRSTRMNTIATEYVPYDVYTFQSTSGLTAFRNRFVFESVGNATRLTVTCELDVNSVFKIVPALATVMLRRTLEANLATMKKVLENKKA